MPSRPRANPRLRSDAPRARRSARGRKPGDVRARRDRKSTRLNSSHLGISYAVFCLKKKEHTSELQSLRHVVCRLLLEQKKRGPSHSDAVCCNHLTAFMNRPVASSQASVALAMVLEV